MTRPWARGAATGVGSLPGEDFAESLRLVLGENPLFPYLPELPARGTGGDIIGRTAALLVDLAVDVEPTGWRLTAHPGRDLRQARDLLERDLDTLEETAADHAGPFKVQAAGPWTLAAGIELPSGHRVLTDHGAVRDLTESLAEGLRLHLADVARRLPLATLVGQLDEPSLPAALAGQIPTASGWGTVRSIEIARARATLAAVLAVLPEGGRVVHCCAADAPVVLLREAGATALGLDLALLRKSGVDAVGEAIDAGLTLLLGVVPGTDSPIRLEKVRERLTGWWNEVGFPPEQLADVVVPTPACGMAGASPRYARKVTTLLRDVGHAIAEG